MDFIIISKYINLHYFQFLLTARLCGSYCHAIFNVKPISLTFYLNMPATIAPKIQPWSVQVSISPSYG